MPIGSATMNNFIHWIAIHKKEINSLSHLPEMELIQLADEFEKGKLIGNEVLTEKWKGGFRMLLKDKWSDFGYDKAMVELERAGL